MNNLRQLSSFVYADRLEPGDRIWAHVPTVSYGGVGIVEDPVLPVNEFMVQNEQGERVPILHADGL